MPRNAQRMIIVQTHHQITQDMPRSILKPSLFPLENTRVNTNDNDQTNHNQRGRHQRNKRHTTPTSREFAPDDPMLALEIAMEAYEQHDDGDAEESGAEGFADFAQAEAVGRVGGSVALALGDGGVEAEELGYGYADGGEGEGGAEPG